jgi:hypothetical protein
VCAKCKSVTVSGKGKAEIILTQFCSYGDFAAKKKPEPEGLEQKERNQESS